MGIRAIPGKTDLATMNPMLAAEWHPTKNGDLLPSQVTVGSGRKVWWQCATCGHEWAATINDRSKGKGCPVCAGKIVAPGINDLATVSPKLAAEWHPTKNGDLLPAQVMVGSDRKVWWLCPDRGHEWAARVGGRSRGAGCPVCAGQVVASGGNDLATLNPTLAAEWHPTNNGDLLPAQVMVGSSRKVWWLCRDRGHEWAARVGSRSKGAGCPVCAGQVVASGGNDLATLNPTLAAEWHPTNNGDLLPAQVMVGSNRKVWWLCRDRGHEWAAAIGDRSKGRGCPVCAGQVAAPGVNDLATVSPKLAAEWHPTKNGGLLPSQVTAGSRREVWWLCRACGGDFETTVSRRTSDGAGCACRLTYNTTRKLAHLAQGLLDSPELLSDAARYSIVAGLGIAPGSEFGQAVIQGDRAALLAIVDQAQRDDLPDGESERIIRGDEHIKLTVDAPGAEFDVEPARPAARAVPNGQAAEADSPVPLPSQLMPSQAVLAHADPLRLADMVTEVVATLWDQMFRLTDAGDDAATQAWLADARTPAANPFAAEVNARFLAEYEAAVALVPPTGWSFRPTPDAPVTTPNLMQRHAALMVTRLRHTGNFSSTGAGKTAAAVLASRLVDADLTVVVCPNNTVPGWVSTITNCFPDARVASRTLEPVWEPGDGPRWLVLHYDLLSTQPDAAKALAAREQIDFLVIDEIHWAKIRDIAESSIRRGVLTHMRGMLAPDACVLGMSATPVINDLREGKSILDLIEGRDTGLNVRPLVENAVDLYWRLRRIGFRARIKPRAVLTQVEPTVDASGALADLLTAHPSRYDAIIAPYLYDVIVAEARAARARGRGVLVYTQYVADLIGPLRAHLNAAGLRVELFTGDEKFGIADLRRDGVDVLIGTEAVGTGVDGLQHWADTLVFAALPWTDAAFEQIRGRIHRQGSTAAAVRVVIPKASVTGPLGTWDYSQLRLDRIDQKKTLASCAVDGDIPAHLVPSVDRAQRTLRTLLGRMAGTASEGQVA